MDKLYFKNLFSREKIFKIQFVYGFVFIYLIFVMYMCCHLSGLPPLNSGIGSETHSFPHFSSMSSIAPIFRNTWLFHYFLPFLVQTGFWVGAPRKETFAPITKVKCIVCIVHSKTQHYFDPSRESGLELELRFFQANSGGCYEQA